MVDVSISLLNAPFVDTKTGMLTDVGGAIMQALIARTGGPAGGVAVLQGQAPGWGTPTGTLDRAAFATSPALPVGGAYSQAELTAIRDFLIEVAQRVGALITDDLGSGVIGS